ncbi:MAG: FHA domain-containing protein [Myxococcota bacterium]
MLLGLLIGLLVWRRKERQKANAAQEAAAQRERELRDLAERSDQGRRQAEADRNAAVERAAAQAAQRDPALDQLLNPDIVTLAAAPGSTEAFDTTLKPGTYVFGAAPDADLRLTTSTVSSHHAQIEVDRGGGMRLMDLGSSNGTFVNQTRINARQPVELRIGDVIGLSRGVLLQIHPATRANAASAAGTRSAPGRTKLGD